MQKPATLPSDEQPGDREASTLPVATNISAPFVSEAHYQVRVEEDVAKYRQSLTARTQQHLELFLQALEQGYLLTIVGPPGQRHAQHQ